MTSQYYEDAVECTIEEIPKDTISSIERWKWHDKGDKRVCCQREEDWKLYKKRFRWSELEHAS